MENSKDLQNSNAEESKQLPQNGYNIANLKYTRNITTFTLIKREYNKTTQKSNESSEINSILNLKDFKVEDSEDSKDLLQKPAENTKTDQSKQNNSTNTGYNTSNSRANRLDAVLEQMLTTDEPQEPKIKKFLFKGIDSYSESMSVSQSMGTDSNLISGTKKRRNSNFLTPLPIKIKELKNSFDTNLEDTKTIPAEKLRKYLPYFVKPENIRDAEGNFLTDPGYDPTTLFVPDEYWKSKDMSTTQKQYWERKAENYDKILLFKYGKFYEIYYDDAITCQRLLGLNWVGNRLQVGIAERSFDYHVQKLVDRGYKVAVVEQLETSRQMDQRVKNTLGSKKSARLMRRKTVQLLSKGTFAGKFYSSASPRYLMAIKSESNFAKQKYIGICFFDITSNTLNIGSIVDDEHLSLFKTLIWQINPIEVVYKETGFDPQIKAVLCSPIVSPLFSKLDGAKFWSVHEARTHIVTYFGNDEELWPNALYQVQLLPSKENEVAMSALSGCLSYLSKMLIFERAMEAGKFLFYDAKSLAKTSMALDSQALDHLEIYRAVQPSNNTLKGSLFNYINRTRTPYGERLLKNWLLSPLLDPDLINDRLDAIEDIQKLGKIIADFRIGISRLPDLERSLTRLYNYGYNQGEKIMLFEDMSVIRLREYQMLLNQMRAARHSFLMLVRRRNDFKSQILRNLTNFQSFSQLSEEQLRDPTILPDPLHLVLHFANMIKWEGEMNVYKRAVPRPGSDAEYDTAKKDVDAIHREFDEYLIEIRRRFNEKGICYANAKYRYELEFPEFVVEGKKKPPEFEFTSKKKHFQRFHTKKIKQMLLRLEDKEEYMNYCFNKFLNSIFSRFGKNAFVWDRFVNALAQIDCLAALTTLSAGNRDMVRPMLYPLGSEPFFYARQLRHPYLFNEKKIFIPNDILLGTDPESRDENPAPSKNIIMLTGPNSSGKSTLLRQVCNVAILAQIGCYVPAREFRMSITDRIFTRMGASDSLESTKSTFYMELQETAVALKHATNDSLVIMDELGTGTSIYDGFSVAYGVAKHLVKTMKCRVLFVTHYSELVDELGDGYSNLGNFYMDYVYDPESGKLVYKYKLKEGRSPQSFGLQVAAAAGITLEIIERAQQKAAEFDKKINLKYKVVLCKKFIKSLVELKALNELIEREEDDSAITTTYS